MAHGVRTTPAGARRPGAAAADVMSRRPWRAWRTRRDGWPALVAAGFTLVQLVLVRPGMGLGWDESVYVSQVSGHAPAAFFSAPRARGVPLLVAPIAAWSSSTPLLRIYLALLSGLALYLALRVWRGLLPTRVVALGGALFATLWITLFYGPQAMPNLWVAIGALICVGCFLRAGADPGGRAAPWGVFAAVALMALMRPTDAVWTVLPLLALTVAVRRWRRPRLLAALLVGLAAGAAQWVVEAYVAYGGLMQRLSDGSRIQGGLGWQLAFDDQLRSLGGRALCRPCTGALAHPALTAWWFLLPVLAVLGLVVAVRARRATRTVVLLACATTAAFPYLLLIGYAAPRFLLPAYALLALPVADALVHLVTAVRGAWRPYVVAAVVLGLAAHLAVQFTILERAVHRNTLARQTWARTATDLHRLGVRPPCVLTGHEAVPIAFYARCDSRQPRGHDTSVTEAGLERAARETPVAVLTTTGAEPPAFARDWPARRAGEVTAYVAPFVLREG